MDRTGLKNSLRPPSSPVERLRNNALAWLNFQEGAGSTLWDASENGLDAIATVAPTWEQSQVGKGANFGAGYAKITGHANQDIYGFSCIIVFKAVGFTGTTRTLADMGYSVTPYGAIANLRADANTINPYLKNKAGTSSAFASISFTPDTQQIFGASWNGTSIQYYMNGAASGTPVTIDGPASWGSISGQVSLGATQAGLNVAGASISFFGVWKRALTAYEMRMMYQYLMAGKKFQEQALQHLNTTSYAGRHDPAAWITIPTYEGSGEAVHPSVVRISGGWAGYEYWMAMTPYPTGNSLYENPSIIASHDGVQWVVPAGMTNPIEPAPAPPEFNCDPELIFLPEQNKLQCYYTTTGVKTRYRLISDDMSVSAPQNTNISRQISVVRDTPGNYLAIAGANTAVIETYTSSDGITLTRGDDIEINMPGWTVWHVGMIHSGGLYHILAAMYGSGSSSAATVLYYGTTENFGDDISNFRLIASPGTGWTNRQIYKAAMLNLTDRYRVYLSARGKTLSNVNVWGTGFSDTLITYP